MKKKMPPVTPPKFKLNLNSSTRQVIVAAIVVLVVFLIALISSMPRKEAMQETARKTGESKEIRSGTQVARISITRPGETSETGEASQPMDHKVEGGMMAMGAEGSIAAGNRVQFKIDTFQKLATQPLKFKIFDERGAELTPDYLLTAHEQKVHFILVSASLREYQHLHPEYRDGQWNVSAFMPTPGTYYAYVDITPVKGDPVVLRNNLTVRAPTTGTVKYPGLTPSYLAITDGYNTALSLNNSASGKVTKLSFRLTKGGNPVTDVRPYLGAFGHTVVLQHGDPASFTHLHPLEVADETKGVFEFEATFSKPGRYTVFAEFKIGSKVELFPITFDIT